MTRGTVKSDLPPARVLNVPQNAVGLDSTFQGGDEWVSVGGVTVPKSALKHVRKQDGSIEYVTDFSGRYIIDDLSRVLPSQRSAGEVSFVNNIDEAFLQGKQLGEIPLTGKHMFEDGKVYTLTAGGLRKKEMEGVIAINTRTNPPTIIVDLNYKSKAEKDTTDGIETNGGEVITQNEAPEALKAKENETFQQWEERMQKYASYALYLGLGIVAITTVASFINWLKGDTDAVNNEVFRIKDIKREGKITYTSQYKICNGDRIYEFRGFENVNRAAMNNYPTYTTNGGNGQLDDSSQTFEAIEAGVTVTPPSGQELTFRVETTALRRLSCALANVARDLASGAANLGKNVTKGFWEGLGIDPVWLIGGIILLIILAIVASVFLK